MADIITLQSRRVWTTSDTQGVANAADVLAYTRVIPFVHFLSGSIGERSSITFRFLSGAERRRKSLSDLDVSIVFTSGADASGSARSPGEPIEHYGGFLIWRAIVEGTVNFTGEILLIGR